MKTVKTRHALLMSVISLVLCLAMMTGTTFAWFTDTAVSANNIIASGKLDVAMYWADGTKAVPADDSADWKDASTGAIFNYDKWEPGYVEVRHVKIANEGTLAFKYKVEITANGTVSDLANVIDVYYVDPAVQVADRTELVDAYKLGTLAQVLTGLADSGNGTLLAGKDDTITLALKMQETAGNDYQDKEIGSTFSVQVYATQLASEKDSFNEKYDEIADYDGEVSTLTALGAAAEKGGNYKFVANIAAETPVAVPAGETVLFDLNGKILEGSVVAGTGATLTIGNGTISNADSDYSGIQSNAANLTINNANITSARHAVRIEGGTAVINGGTYKTVASPDRAAAMTQHALNVSGDAKVTIIDGTFVGPKGTGADSGSAVNVQAGAEVIIKGGNFSGGLNKTLSAKGTLTIYGGKFDQDPSAYVADGYVANKNADGIWTVEKRTADTWDGTADTSWYNDEATTFTLTTAEQFAGLAVLVDGGNTFAGKTIELGVSLDLYAEDADGNRIFFEPIGDESNDFSGVFDGKNNIIYNLRQDCNAKHVALFGAVYESTVKNFTIDGALIENNGNGYAAIVAAYTGASNFENITLTNSTVVNYNHNTGGIVAWCSNNGTTTTFDGINIEASVTVGSWWGSPDTRVGGIVGAMNTGNNIVIKNSTVACTLDVYNDVVANYQWYNYRMAGMIVGDVRDTANVDGRTQANPVRVTCENVTVIFGDWTNYHYCESAAYGTPSYADEGEYKFNRVEAGLGYGGIDLSACNHAADETHNELIKFDCLFGARDGKGIYGIGIEEYGLNKGVTVVYNNK